MMPRYPLSGAFGQRRALITRTSLLTNRQEPPNPYLTGTWTLKPQVPEGTARPCKRQKSTSSSRGSRGRSLSTILPLSPEAAKPPAPEVTFQSLPSDIIAAICFSGYLDTVFVHTR
jgi:hypothetical protein